MGSLVVKEVFLHGCKLGVDPISSDFLALRHSLQNKQTQFVHHLSLPCVWLALLLHGSVRAFIIIIMVSAECIQYV